MDAPNPTAVYGKYHLLELVARGGMAEVFKAKARGVEGFEKVVVIKRILPELAANRRFVEMFVQEAKLAVALSHANIVQVFDLGRADETYFIAMEYVAGYDLARVIRRAARHGRRIEPGLAAYVAAEVAKGLDYAHRRRDAAGRPLGIVHRDVSPHNILLSFEGEVKLTDFGIAKARTIVEPDEEAGMLKGKYAYMAPEQALDQEVDARADLFALGVVLYEMLAGHNPFLAASDYETLQRVRAGHAEPLQQVAPHVPGELAEVVARAMAPRREDRYESAAALYEDLVRYLFASGQRVGARTVAAFLEELRSVSEQRAVRAREARLREAFEPVSGERSQEAADLTPVEVPSSARSVAGSAPRTPARGAVTPSARAARLEQRDASLLTLRAPAVGPWPEGELRALVRRFGGISGGHRIETSEEGEARLWTAIFGIRQADGRDAERAVACGLRALRLLRGAEEGAELVQAVVHEGRLLVDASGELVRDARFDRLLRQAETAVVGAPEGKLLVTPSVERLVAARFELTPDPDDPAAGSLVQGERLVLQPLGPMVGRQAALRAVGEAVASASQHGARLVVVEGVAGSGKSRLLAEVAARLTGREHAVGLSWVDLVGFGREAPLSGVHEVLRALLGVTEGLDEARLRQRVERVRELGLAEPDVALLAAVLGLGEGADLPVEGVSRRLRDVLGRLLAGFARDGLHLVVLDGAEHLDARSAEVVAAAVAELHAAPVVVLAAERTEPGREPRLGARAAERVVLEPLGRAELQELVASRLGAEQVPTELLAELEAFSRGNPRMAVEYLEALQASGAVTLEGGRLRFAPERARAEVPRTLRGVLEARIAGIEPEERFLLRACAFLRERITAELLADLADVGVQAAERSLERFEEMGLLARRAGGDYGLAHDLLGRVLRDGVPSDERRAMHAAVAEALERLHPEPGSELAERIAFHLHRAGEGRRAARYLERAAARLEGEFALEAAIDLLLRAESWLAAEAHDQRLELFRRIGELSVRARAAERGLRAMERAVAMAEGLGRDEDAARFALLAGRLLVVSNRVGEGRSWLQRAEAMARRLGASGLLREVRLATAEAFTRVGEWGRAVEPLREALKLAREAADTPAEYRCLLALSQSFAGCGRQQEARDALEACRLLSERLGDPLARCEYHKNAGLVLLLLGDTDGLLREGERALRLAQEHGFVYEEAVNAHNLGETRMLLGEHRTAFPLLRRSFELCEERGYERLRHLNLRVLGFLDAWRFGSRDGRRLVQEAYEYAREHDYTWDAIQARYMLALLDLAAGEASSAIEGFEEVLRASEEHGNRHYAREAEAALAALRRGEPLRVEDLLGHVPRTSRPPGGPSSSPP